MIETLVIYLSIISLAFINLLVNLCVNETMRSMDESMGLMLTKLSDNKRLNTETID